MKKRLNLKNSIILSGIVIIFLVSGSCATSPGLRITYLLQGGLSEYKGKEIALVFEDNRKTKEILREGAKNEFRLFSGYIGLSILDNNQREFNAGLLDIESLFMETFEKKLSNLGLRIPEEKKEGTARLVIGLNTFTLDLINRRWIVEISYEARIERGEEILSKRSMNGDAERLKIIGSSDADKAVSGIFTDMVNSLDLDKLLEQAAL